MSEINLDRFKSVKESPVIHDGPSPFPNDEPFQGNDKTFSRVKNEQTQYGWQTLFFGPYNLPNAPSFATCITSHLWTYVLSLCYGLIFTLTLHTLLSGTTDVAVQGFILAIVSGGMYWISMILYWEPLLKSHATLITAFAAIGTFDLGIVASFITIIIIMLGQATGGVITSTLLGGAVNAGVIPTAAVPGRWMYWLGGSLIVLSYIFVLKFVHKWEQGEVLPYKRNYFAITVSAIFLAVLTVAFRTLGLYYFDAGLYAAGWAATGNSGDWAFYIFVPFTMSLTALLFYVLFQVGSWLSTKYKPVPVNARYRSSYEKQSY